MSIAASKKTRLARLERAACSDDVLTLEDLVQEGPMRPGRFSRHLAKVLDALASTPDSGTGCAAECEGGAS